jgi:hypothetical protein
MIRGLNTSSPALGDDVRPETRGELKELLQRIEALRERVSLKPMNLLLEPPARIRNGENPPPGQPGDDEDEKDDEK